MHDSTSPPEPPEGPATEPVVARALPDERGRARLHVWAPGLHATRAYLGTALAPRDPRALPDGPRDPESGLLLAAPDVADDVRGEAADLAAGDDLTLREGEGTCIGGAAHDWRPEWLAADTFHGGREWRTQCRRCGLMAFYCPRCEPARRPSYGWSPGLCEAHAADDAPAADVEADLPPATPGPWCATCEGSGRPGTANPCPACHGTGLDPATLADPEARAREFAAAMAARDPDMALAIARAPFPADWPEDMRQPWGARRDLARMAGAREPGDE